MKESKYNIYVEHDGEKLVFNSRTIALAAMDEFALSILQKVKQGVAVEQTDLVKEMERVGFIVDDSIDELQQLEMSYNLNKYQKNGLSLVIAPTMACNFACPYCFESAKSGVMTEETQDKIIALVSEFAEKGQAVDITWFGGEPLLAKSVIYSMSEKFIEICQHAEVNYVARIITNGYLLDESTMLKLKEYKVTFMQMTLDGLPQTHNQRKRLKNSSDEPTFERILENVLLAQKHDINAVIRFNVDKQNVKELEPLLDLVIERGIDEGFYLGHVQGNTDSSKEFSQQCLSAEEFSRLCADFERLLFLKKIQTSYPIPLRLNCGACYLYSYVIEPDGEMYKCWNEIGITEKSIGNIHDFEDGKALGLNLNYNYTQYMNWSPFSFKKCRECKILPICMGGCQYNGMELGEPICENWKYELEEYIKLKYDAS